VEETFMNLGVLLAHCGLSAKTTGGIELVRHGRKIAALAGVRPSSGIRSPAPHNIIPTYIDIT